MVDPVYALSPIARMMRSDAERKRIGKQMAPDFRSFGKGLLITALGCLAVWISFELQGRGQRNAATSQMAASSEYERHRIPFGGSTDSPVSSAFHGSTNRIPPGVPASASTETEPGTTLPGLPMTLAGSDSLASPTPGAAPVEQFPGQPPFVPSPPAHVTRPETPPIPLERLVPSAVMLAWVNGGCGPPRDLSIRTSRSRLFLIAQARPELRKLA